MALIPNLRELFGIPAAPAPMSPAQAAAATTAQIAAASTPGGGTTGNSPVDNPTVPNSTTPQSDGSVPAIPAAAKGDASPMSGYGKIWDTPVDPNTSAASLVPTFSVDPAKMLEAAKTIDFTKSMDPALLDAASKGDASALANIINSAAQAGYAQAATATISITNKMLSEQAKTFSEKYAPAMMRNESISRVVEKAIPLSQDPAFAPVVSALRTQLSNTYPTASAEEIATHTENYLQDFAKRAVESKGGKIQSAEELSTSLLHPMRRPETDWSKWLETPV